MLADQVLVDALDDVEVDLHGVEVEQRHAEFVRGGHGDGPGLGELVVDQVGDQRNFFLAGRFGRIVQLVLGDDAVLDEPPRQSGEIGL